MTFDYVPGVPCTAEVAACEYAAEHGSAVMLVQSPWAVALYRVQDTLWVDHEGAPPAWADAFELRAFDVTHELRWLYEGGGLGTPVLVSGSPAAGVPAQAQYRRRLWGEAGTRTGGTTGWVALRDARIGTLHVPAPPRTRGDRSVVGLVAVEAAEQDEYGNWAVSDERWTGLEWLS